MKNGTLGFCFSLISVFLVSCTDGFSSASPSNELEYYARHAVTLTEVLGKYLEFKSFILIIHKENCSHCLNAEPLLQKYLNSDSPEVYCLNTTSQKDLASTDFYSQIVACYLSQTEYAENQKLFDSKNPKVFAPSLISIKNGHPNFALIGLPAADAGVRLNRLIQMNK